VGRLLPSVVPSSPTDVQPVSPMKKTGARRRPDDAVVLGGPKIGWEPRTQDSSTITRKHAKAGDKVSPKV
jgi:hypothetical protein